MSKNKLVKSNFPIYIVNAFTKSPFQGNPAAVCLVPFNYDAESDLKLKIAAEMNLSETAFLKPLSETDSFQSGKRFSLSWFTPTTEVPLCGHATLATAAVLFKECNNESQVIEFETLSGILKAEKVQNNRIQLNLPAYEPSPVNEEYKKLVKAFSKYLPVEEAVISVSKNVLIHLSDTVTRKEFEAIKTNDSELLSAVSGIIGVILTVKASGEQCVDEDGNSYDFLSRYFAPWSGVSEDPVCGSAHAVLAPYWAKILKKETFYAQIGRSCQQRLVSSQHISLNLNFKMNNFKSEKVKFYPIYIVDAFTNHPFCGNPAAVCLFPFDHDADNDLKQRIASEMNLSETAFLKTIKESDTFQSGKRFSLDWFTPLCQVPLCGHATLASAAVLLMDCNNESQVLEFETVSGILKAQKVPPNRIQIDLPAYESHPVHDKYKTVVEAVVKNLPVQEVVLSLSKKLLIRLNDSVTRKELESFKTNDAELLAAAPDIAGIAVTLKGSSEDCIDEDGNKYDFVSRYFSPWFGISEDPVTGSAHSVLAPYWSKILQKNNLYARQCSRRGGELHIDLQKGRVLISGNASVVVKGEIHI